MKIEELAFAAQVFSLAMEIATDKHQSYKIEIKNEPNRDELLAAFEEAHPSSSYVPEAYKLLEKVASKIRDIRAEQGQ